MGKSQKKDLLKFLKPFPPAIRKRALWLRDFVWDLYPGTNELIYDNYNAVAFGWSLTDPVSHLFCNVAVGRSSYNVQFGFYYGSALSDPKKLLLGQGNQYRYLLVNDINEFPKAYVKKLLEKAFYNSQKKVKDKSQLMAGKTIVKSISKAKRPVAARLRKKS